MFGAVIAMALLSGCTGSKTGSGGFTQPVQAASPPTLAQTVAAGGVVTLPSGVTQVDCTSQLVISKDTKLEGTGSGTIISDSCPSGDTILVTAGDVEISRLTIQRNATAGNGIRFTGDLAPIPNNPAPNGPGIDSLTQKLVMRSVVVTGAYNGLMSDGGHNLLSVYESVFKKNVNDGAVIGSFGVTMHANWFSANNHNGVTFVKAGFCAECMGNEYWSNGNHGIEYSSALGNIDPRHIGEYVDSNGSTGLIIDGFVRDFAFLDGWVGGNVGTGMIVTDTIWGTVITGNTFVNNTGQSLIVTETSAPLRVSNNISSVSHSPTCDATINGQCVDLNKQ